MTLSPLESRISTLRQEAREMVTLGYAKGAVGELFVGVSAAGAAFAAELHTPTPAGRTYLHALCAADARDIGRVLFWLEQCAAHLASERMAREPQDGGCFGARR